MKRAHWVALLAASLMAIGCGDSGMSAPSIDAGSHPSDDSGTNNPDAGTGSLGPLPTANAAFDYQLGGGYQPVAGVVIVSRDREDTPAQNLYNICYVNGFQTQPGERDFWLASHPKLLLRDANGDIVIDPVWNEVILDVRTAEFRQELTTIVGGWIKGCKTAGFDAVEIDNLDTYSRSNGLISQDQAVMFMRMLTDIAHQQGLPIAQKNSAEVLGRRSEMQTDFAVVEECNRFSECADFTAVYGDEVFIIEYRKQDFDAGCTNYPGLSIILRDVELRLPGDTGYVFAGC